MNIKNLVFFLKLQFGVFVELIYHINLMINNKKYFVNGYFKNFDILSKYLVLFQKFNLK